MSPRSPALEQIKAKVCALEAALTTIERWRQSKASKIIFTNGVFDLVHRGHLTYLASAADLGTHLIIGVNSDSSVKRLKGLQRPIFDEETRCLKLAGLAFVDLVIPFTGDTPLDCIERILPDVLVKGGDYLPDDIVGAEAVRAAGGQVLTIPLEKGLSSTSIIERIKGLT